MRDVTLEDGSKLPVKSLRYATVKQMREKNLTPDTIHLNPGGSDEALEIEFTEVFGAEKTRQLLEGDDTLNSDLMRLHRGIWAETMGIEDEEKN